jgi:hypothetical protein
MARKHPAEDEGPIKARLTRLPLSEEDAADLVTFLLGVARKQRAARETENHTTGDAARAEAALRLVRAHQPD